MAECSSLTQCKEIPASRGRGLFLKGRLSFLKGLWLCVLTVLGVSLTAALPLGPGHGDRIVPPLLYQHADDLLDAVHDEVTSHFLPNQRQLVGFNWNNSFALKVTALLYKIWTFSDLFII